MKKTNKNVIKAVLCASVLMVSLYTAPMISASAIAAPAEPAAAQPQDPVSPQAEETEWVLRLHNGKIQKRLWSYTRGIWLTDWIDVN